MMNALVLLTASLFAIPLTIFCVYGLILLYYGKKRTGESDQLNLTGGNNGFPPVAYEPTVSVVIPTHNEQAVIAKRIDNLLTSNYPREKLEIIFVDDSLDSTPKIIQEYVEKYPQIRIIHFDERMGYSPCLIAGCNAAKGDVVALAEASSLMDRNAIRYLVSNFVNSGIGVVTGKSVILNEDENAARSESFYLRLLDFVRRAESNMDSTVYMKGEAAAVRREVLLDLKELENCPGTADTGIMLLARKKGFKAIYDPRVQFFEYAPTSHVERVTQKVTRGANLIKVLWAFRDMFLNPKYGKFGMITLPVEFAMLAIVPVLLLAGVCVFVILSATAPLTYLPLWVLGVCLFALAYVFWRPTLFAALESEYSLLKGLYDTIILKKSHDKIDKVMSTRRS